MKNSADFRCSNQATVIKPYRHMATMLPLILVLLKSEPVRGDEMRDPSCMEVVVGITPNCPYGMRSCWPNAKAALERVSLIKRTEDVDYYNCTARILLKNAGLPDVAALRDQFAAIVGGNYGLRGVEITLKGTLEIKNGELHLTAEAPAISIPLAKLEHKLQWNFQKQHARGPEDEERAAYQELLDKVAARAPFKLKASVTGPLYTPVATADTDTERILEVREYIELQSVP